MERKKRILIVDDEPANVKLLTNMLISLGYESESVFNGQAALESLHKNIDLILSDIMMPQIDGYELCRQIRNSPDYGDVPVVLVTILSDREDRIRAVQAGASDFISKPVDKLELQVRLASLLSMKQAQDRVKQYTRELEIAVEERTASLRKSEARCRQLYEESRGREELYHSFITASPDALVIFDLEGKATYVSPSFTRIFGWTSVEIIGKQIPFVPESHLRATREALTKILDGNIVSGFETRRLCKDGRILEVSISASRYQDFAGNPAGLIVILHDISERKRMEEALRANEELFRTVFEAAQDGIFIKDNELKYTHVNPAMLEIMECSASDILGKTDEDVFGQLVPGGLVKQEQRVLSGETIESEHQMMRSTWPMTLNFLRFPMKDAEGEIVGICGIARDVTERRGTLEQIQVEPCLSKIMQQTLDNIQLVAKTDSTLLLLGENGSGKDYLAQYLHDHSKRSSGPFFNVNCAALVSELADSELFGHEAGAFTGARGKKRGFFELAEGGTLLLNEIGELLPNLQAKLLTFLDTQSFTRVGGEKVISVNVRLIAATNKDLKAEVDSGKFRRDLFYRLNVFCVLVPPLRERREDIPGLVREILVALADKMGIRKLPFLSTEAIDALKQYEWPGNVRELRNVLERALILCRNTTIRPEHLVLNPTPLSSEPSSLEHNTSLPLALKQTKITMISRALDRSGGSIKEAANILGISRESLKHHIRTLGLRG